MNEKFSLRTCLRENSDLLRQIALEHLKAYRRTRRWRVFYKLTFFAVVVLSFIFLWPTGESAGLLRAKPHVGLIDIRGQIFEGAPSSADHIAEALYNAYQDTGTRAIILRINSPGGSAVQADYIYNEIMRYRALHPKVKVYAVCTDVCASAAYYIAAAANEIYANPASLVGSIGVVYNGFGFVDLMKKVGVERRLITAGEHKGFLDPFSPASEEEAGLLKEILDHVHKQFENKVEQGRGARLHKTPTLYSGLFWSGDQAKALGLIDGFGSAGSVARDVIKTKQIVNYTIEDSYFEKFAHEFGLGLSDAFLMKLNAIF